LGWLSTTPGAFTEPDDRQTARREHSTHFYDLTEITIPLGPFDGGRGGSIAEIGDGFIFV
jgi:hypothetical protein